MSKNIFRSFLKYVSLNILGQMAYSCYTLADTFFISSSLGANGLTALNLAFPVFCLINGTGLLIGMGGGIRYSILKGREEHKQADSVFTNAFYAALSFSVLFVLSGIFLSGALTNMLGADDTVFSMTNTYLRVMLLFAPAFLMNNLFQCFVRNDGCPSLSMAAMIFGSLSNVALDYIFIFPLQMGIFGAILATCLAPVLSMAVLSSCFFSRKNHFHFIRSTMNPKIISGIVSSGIPPFVTELTSGVVMLLFNFIILHLAGNTGVAAFSIITVISLVVVAIYTGLSQGIRPLFSLNHGTGDRRGVKVVWRYAMITMLLLSGTLYLAIFFQAPQLSLVFNSERNALLQEFVVTGMKLYFLACPFMGFNIITATYFTSTERSRPAQVISLLRGFFVLIPVAFLLSAFFKMIGVWCAYPLTEFIVALTGAALYIISKKKKAF